jgi:hypothetical protein
MAEEQLRDIIDAMRARIQAELDAQIEALTARHRDAVATARREAEQTAEAAAEQRWAAKLDAVREEWNTRLRGEIAAARADADQRLAAEIARARSEADRDAADATARARRELEQAVLAERHRNEEQFQQTLTALEAERQQAEADAQASRATATVDASPLLSAIQSIQHASSLSEALAALAVGAAAHAPRVALFIVNGSHLDEWSVAGIAPISSGSIDVSSGDASLLATALRQAAPAMSSANDPDHQPPSFASLSPGRRAAAIPLTIGGQAVAVLYADEGNGTAGSSGAWETAVELLARHAAACLAELTAVRALQLLQGSNGRQAEERRVAADDDHSARRYAKLLVSEIKLYNEGAVRVGREQRDLLRRLDAEIQRARRLFDERVPPTVGARGFYFHQELVDTLAGGDPTLLGPEPRL